MKVKELIEKLGKYDPEIEVVIDSSRDGSSATSIMGIVALNFGRGLVVILHSSWTQEELELRR